MTAIIAVNVLRARDRWPTNYTTLSGIKSNPTLSLNGSRQFRSAGTWQCALPFAGSSASISRNETANAEYSVNPFSNNDKTQGLLKPIQPEHAAELLARGLAARDTDVAVRRCRDIRGR